jgi:gamma-glutamyltranspeptidase / glutathione hydrolase
MALGRNWKKAAAAAFFLFCVIAPLHAREPVVAKQFMVAAAHPLAVQAGYDMLERGGSALDAAIAVQMVLGLVEPESSGIGGGAFLVHWSESGQEVATYDGREIAPAAARVERFMRDGRALGFMQAVLSGRSVGVPGVLRMLEAAHRRHGRLAWRELFAPAIRLAEEGFAVSPRLRRVLDEEQHLRDDPAARRIFYEGDRIRNPEYAATLRAIARRGADGFYEGEIAADIARAVRSHGGDMSEQDLAAYRALERPPLCASYRVWRLCSMGPPSSGGIAVLQILGILENTRFAAAPPRSEEAVHLFSEAGKLAYADRARYLGDPDFTPVPVERLLSPSYLRARARLIHKSATRRAPPGDREGGTSHLSIVAPDGDAVAMTTTIESSFGSRIMVRGFLLNNELTDFDFVPGGPNEPGPRKRPRSSMAPMLVFRAGELQAALGSPGGSAIINYVAKTLVGLLDWRLDIQGAIEVPNFGSRNGPLELEAGSALEALAKPLAARGHLVELHELPSGVHGIERVPGGWRGGADPRREGVARGR